MPPARRVTTAETDTGPDMTDTTPDDPDPTPDGARRAAAGLLGLVLLGLVVTIGVITTGAAGPSSAQGDGIPRSDCPAMTDSIRRLYQGFFVREPETAEFEEWVVAYRTGEVGLEQMAQSLADSREFERRYPDVEDADFVEIVYRNTLRREPTEQERADWLRSLEAGTARGTLMVAFSEAEQFVDRTNTATPLAGFLKRYPQGAHWYCGAGSRAGLSVQPLEGDGLHADLLFHNAGSAGTDYELHTIEGGSRNALMARGTLGSGHTQYTWDGDFAGDGFYGDGLDIVVSDRTSWIVIFYVGSIGEDRLGWQVEPART